MMTKIMLLSLLLNMGLPTNIPTSLLEVYKIENTSVVSLTKKKERTAEDTRIENYFRYHGVETLADLAHPTWTFSHGYFNVYSNKVWVKCYYTDGSIVEVEVSRWNNLFVSMNVLQDSAILIGAFQGVGVMKDLFLELIKTDQDRANKNYFEQVVGEKISEMSGRTLACMFITFGLLNY